MATRTSSQSGNFNSTSTWGGSAVPIDGDDFVITQGHIVTVNSDIRTTNGYHDSFVHGKLHITTNGQLRMNGTLLVRQHTGTVGGYFAEGDSNTGPYLRMDNGGRLEINGDDAANHALRGETHKYVWIECEGTDPRPKTTLSAIETIGSSSLAFTSASNFRAGDWIHLYVEAENIADWEREKAPREESFIIHDISSNTVYFRQFVTPTATISRVSGSKIFVDDAEVFREGQKIIFGTGSNRNVKTITSIGKGSNRITCDSNITGSVVGQTVYQTGSEKWHGSGDSVQAMATPLTADSSSGSNTITVANPNGFSVGDRILIEANNNSDTNWDYVMDYVIQSISSNTITLTTNLANNRYTGGWVTNFERDTQITAVSEDMTGTSSQRPYIWIEHWTSGDAYYRKIRFRNIGLYGIGSNSTNTSYYRGLGMGRCSYETNSYGQYTSGLEGCAWHPNNSGSNSCIYWRESHYQRMSRNTCYNGHLNFWRWSSGNDICMTANISWRASYSCFHMDGFYEPRTCFAYNHASRSDDYGMFIYHGRDQQVEVRHNYFTHHENRPFYFYYQTQNFLMERNYFNYYRYWPYIGRGGGDVIHLNSYFGNGWDITTGNTSPINGIYINSDSLRPDRNARMTRCTSVNHNFKEGATVEWAGQWWKEWDEDEAAWRYRRDLSSSNWAGDTESMLVPAGATVYVAAEIKLTSGFSGNMPFLMARTQQQHNRGAYLTGPTDTSYSPSSENPDGYPMGHYANVAFTSSAIGSYERKTLTLNPVNYDYYIVVAVVSDSTNAGNGDEGWHQKPIELYADKLSSVKEKKFITSHQVRRGQNSSTTRKKKRLGGRLK